MAADEIQVTQGTNSNQLYIDPIALEVAEPEPIPELATMALPTGELVVRSMERREIDAKIAPYNEIVDTPIGLEMFKPGSFAHVDPRKVVLRLEHDNPAAGRGIAIEDRADGSYMTFRVSKTGRGDEILTLAADGVTPHVSVGYDPSRSQSEVTRNKAGRRVTEHSRVDLREVSTTWKPYYDSAAVLAVRAQEEIPMAEATATPDNGTANHDADVLGVIKGLQETNLRLVDRVGDLEERSRREIIVPTRTEIQPAAKINDWMQVSMRMLIGDRIQERELQERGLSDIITSDAPGVVPDAFLPGLIDIIDPQRPFLESTRRIATPGSGMSITVPVLGTRAVVGVQDQGEKTDIASGPVTVTTKTFDAITIAGGADVSIQLIRRSDPSFADLLIAELGEAYAALSDEEAITALFNAGTTPGTGNIDPDDLEIGEAWANSLTNSKRPPDTIWLSSDAVQAFIDAKAAGTNAPLYSSLNADFTAAGGPGGRISGLRPIYVPALDGTSVDAIIGPSSRFAWAEDGTFTLQVDVPSKAGRDIALVGLLFLLPLNPAAFTTYDLGS